MLDLSDDGRRVAVGVRRLADNATTDHRRYGDPTYFAPSMVELMVIDTATGAADRIGKGLLNVRQAAWNASASKLAVLTAAENAAGLPVTTLWVYDAERKTLAEVPRAAGSSVAANSELAWTPDGAKLFVALRNSDDDKAAQSSFKTLVVRSHRRAVVEAVPGLGRDEPLQPQAGAGRDRSGHRRRAPSWCRRRRSRITSSPGTDRL